MLNRTDKTEAILNKAAIYAIAERKEFLTPEMVLAGFFQTEEGQKIIQSFQADTEDMNQYLEKALEQTPSVPEDIGDYDIMFSMQLAEATRNAEMMALAAGKTAIEPTHLIYGITMLENSYAQTILATFITPNTTELTAALIAVYNGEDLPLQVAENSYAPPFTFDEGEGEEEASPTINEANEAPSQQPQPQSKDWHALVTCINDLLDTHNPLIGREAELQRTIEILCRKDKNNPLHVGEPGVGKTALVFGLAAIIDSPQVPARLRGARIYQLDMGTLIAGTQYRGEFEKRINAIMRGAEKEGNAIIYIDEIHTLIGSGAISDGALDGSNILKPYLESGTIRFIGSTTYQEYNRYFKKSKGIVRRFQQIDIHEPSIDQTVDILLGLREKYETFHHVTYPDDIIRYAVEASAKYINGRFLPDKAIDLIDEAGAKAETKRKTDKPRRTKITRAIIDDILANICKIDPAMLKESDDANLETLDKRISKQIYGQDEAVKRVVEAVQMGKAGLLEEGKPIASLLFVGPTGVGKTELCRVLAKELGIELVRFDMSEYAEKHTVAKLIGSPAGYVGYEEGGLLTDAIRKTPHCVLLLDEIEKAHADIYNILLQVMDYARLTDNKGEKADFSHVILIMTSNAGAQYAHQAQVGFSGSVTAGQAMLSTVKKTFKPEFLARLSDTVVFRDMDRHMAALILDKKLRQLSRRLAARKVTLSLSPAAHDYLLTQGYNQKMGAREMDRTINSLLAPLLMRQILFGPLKHGGTARVEVEDLIHNS